MFFLLYAFFFSDPHFFCALRLGPRRGLCALSALNAFNNYAITNINIIKEKHKQLILFMSITVTN
ncbi:hypothetical protein Hanom_Chr08g00731481 [Helianthus anomalus]